MAEQLGDDKKVPCLARYRDYLNINPDLINSLEYYIPCLRYFKMPYSWYINAILTNLLLNRKKDNMSHNNNSILFQRRIEAQLLKPVIEGLSSVYSEEDVINNIRGTIEKIAFENGRKLHEEYKNNSLYTLADHWRKLAEGDSLVIENFMISASKLTFRITHCKYAEYYKKIRAEKLGDTLSCCRDKAFLNGFSEEIEMYRSKTILDGNKACDFAYTYKKNNKNDKAER